MIGLCQNRVRFLGRITPHNCLQSPSRLLPRDGTYDSLQGDSFVQLFLFQRAVMNGEAAQLAIQNRLSRIALFGRASVANILLRAFGKAVVVQRNRKFLAPGMTNHVHALH